jgi:hypothetical protein
LGGTGIENGTSTVSRIKTPVDVGYPPGKKRMTFTGLGAPAGPPSLNRPPAAWVHARMTGIQNPGGVPWRIPRTPAATALSQAPVAAAAAAAKNSVSAAEIVTDYRTTGAVAVQRLAPIQLPDPAADPIQPIHQLLLVFRQLAFLRGPPYVANPWRPMT